MEYRFLKMLLSAKTVRFSALVVLITLLAGCRQPTPSPSGILAAMQQMQELATVEYTLTKVIKAKDDQSWYKIGDRKILITCEAKVKAGIDFTAMDTRYISKTGKRISIQMPPPKIISVNLPPEKIIVAYQEIGYFRTKFNVAEQNDLIIQAEKQIVAKSNELGILEEARNNTRTLLTGYLSKLGFEEIDLQFDSPIKPYKD